MLDKKYIIQQLNKAGPFDLTAIKEYVEYLTPRTHVRITTRIDAPFSIFVDNAVDVLYEKGEIPHRSRFQLGKYAVSFLIMEMIEELKARDNINNVTRTREEEEEKEKERGEEISTESTGESEENET